MTIFTNGSKIVIAQNNDPATHEELAKNLKVRAKDVLAKKAKFSIGEEPMLHIANVDGLSFEDLKMMCQPDIAVEFRAFGNEKVMLPSETNKDIKHEFSAEEKASIASKMADAQLEKEKTEAEKKAANAGFKEALDTVENSIIELAGKYRQGYEWQTMRCHQHFDFETGNKIFTDIDSGEILHSQPLEKKDFQLRLEFGKMGAIEAPAEDEKGDVKKDDTRDGQEEHPFA